MNKFFVFFLMVLFAVPALAQHRGDYGHGRGYGRGYGRPGYNRPYRPIPRPMPRPGYGRPGYSRPGSCVVAMVNRRGRVIDTYYGYNDYYSRGCSRALQQCRFEISHRGMYANRCVVQY